MADEDSERRDMSDEKYLAVELDGDELKFAIPKDLLLARLLMEHLRHAIEVAELSRAIAVRDQVRKANPASNGIVPGDARMLKGFKGLNN